MPELELGIVQTHFAELIWQHEPISSGELVKICEKELNWKKPTTYTVLRKLCGKGLFQNVNGIVTSLISRDDFYSARSEQFVEETFNGSLPAFIAAFTSHRSISKEEAEKIQKMIDVSLKEST
ncbi:MAG: BlaI/MecI/CopY family transcriptional regulator [Coprococcus sp.]|nr:BlaI/MecI/CopY family transcriptional regulator [Coprococcus sp.]